jgi:glucose/arabinose dehydrogenase
MIITRGSDSNIDTGSAEISSGRSQIRRFALNGTTYDWMEGELLGWGLRNGVGIALDSDGTSLWEVENSADQVYWSGVDVHNVSYHHRRQGLENLAVDKSE